MDSEETARIKSSKFDILDDPKQLKRDILTPPGLMGRALIYLDIDYFKKLNTKYNETLIDKTILPEFQTFLADFIRPFGYVYAEGGDEVIILLNNCSPFLACAIAENIRQTLEQKEFYIKEDTVQLNVSIGIAHSNEHETGTDLQEKANEAKRESKLQGRNRSSIALYDKIESVNLPPLNYNRKKQPTSISHFKLKEMKDEEDAIIAEYISKPYPFYSQFYCAGSWIPNPFFRLLKNDEELLEKVIASLSISRINQLPKVHRSIILLKALDTNGQPCLLHYFSGRPSDGWMTWLLPNIDREASNSKENFLETMADNFRTFFGLTTETITIHNLNALSICVKTNRYAQNPELRFEPKFYAFRYYYATLSDLPDRLLNRSVTISQGSFQRRLRWFYSEELASGADDNKMLESNADVIKTIYGVCRTLLINIPEAISGHRIND